MESVPIYHYSVTWNPWHGCRKVSAGCMNCYMFAGDRRRGLEGSEIRRSKTQFDLPLKKDRNGLYSCRDCLFMTSMTSDFFIEEADGWRDEAWEIIRKRKDVPFVILTKRPERIMDSLPSDWGEGYPNVRLSVSAEDQKAWDLRVPILMSVPSRKRDVFAAPMIGPIDGRKELSTGKIDAVYLGGEYGEFCRPCDFDWVVSLRKDCVDSGVTFYWRNTGKVLIRDGAALEFESLKEQGMYAEAAGLDFFVDRIVHPKQTTLF